MKSQISGRTAKITQEIQIRRSPGKNQHRGAVTRQQFLPSARQYQRDQRVSKNFHGSVFSKPLTQQSHRPKSIAPETHHTTLFQMSRRNQRKRVRHYPKRQRQTANRFAVHLREHFAPIRRFANHLSVLPSRDPVHSAQFSQPQSRQTSEVTQTAARRIRQKLKRILEQASPRSDLERPAIIHSPPNHDNRRQMLLPIRAHPHLRKIVTDKLPHPLDPIRQNPSP